MIFVEQTLAVNPAGAVRLSRDQVWAALERKARNAVPYVVPITSCEVVQEYSAGEFDREVAIAGDRYVERVVLGRRHGRVVYTRVSGPVLGVIVNDIVEPARGELGLRFAFALAVRPDADIPITEAELARRMRVDYVAAIGTTLDAARAMMDDSLQTTIAG